MKRNSIKAMNRVLIFLAAALLTVACTPFKGDPSVAFKNNNALMPEVSYALKDSLQSWIEFWPSTSGVSVRKSSPKKSISQKTTLLNLLPDREYRYQIVAIGTDGDTLRSREFGFKTGMMPEAIYQVRKDKIDSTQFSGHILLRRYYGTGADVLMNSKGEIVWYNLYDTAVRRPITYTPKGTFLSIYDSAIIRENDLYGNVKLNLDLEKLGQPERFHHEVLYDAQENIISLGVDSAKRDLRRWGGEKDQYLRADGIVRMDKTGKILWKWNLLEKFNPDPRKDSVNIKDVWGHANAMVIDKDGNYLVSFRDFSQVWKINSATGEVMWRLGKGGDFNMPVEAHFLRQHSINWTKNGDLIMFDNGERKVRSESRILVLRLDQKNKKASVVNLISLPRGYASYRMCSAQKLSDDRFLVCVTRKDATVMIVDNQARILWKAVCNYSSYRAEMLENPFPF